MKYFSDGHKYINSELLSGFLEQAGRVIGILGMLIICATMVYILAVFFLGYLGKISSYRVHFVRIAYGLIGSLLIIGGMWISMVRFTHKTIIDPVQKVIEEQYEENSYWLPGLEK